MMQKLLKPHGFNYIASTIQEYMKELGLKSIVRRKKQNQEKGSAYKVFPEIINQNFRTDKPNRILCVDFTYLYHNCTIIDLYDRPVV